MPIKILVSGSTDSVFKFGSQRPDRIGILYTPRVRNTLFEKIDLEIGCDNDCFQGLHTGRWLRYLKWLKDKGLKPSFLTCPDSVANHGETKRLWKIWMPVLKELDFKVAFVLQNGLESDLKWFRENLADMDAIFVGGDTRFKLSNFSRDLSRYAKENGKYVHVGRVNSLKRIRKMVRWKCVDSIDGGSYSMFAETYIPTAIKQIDRCLEELKEDNSFLE